MATGICWIEERDVQTDFAMAVELPILAPGGLGSAPRELAVLESDGMDGGIIDPSQIRIRPAPLLVNGVIDGGSLAATTGYRDALADAAARPSDECGLPFKSE